MTRYRIPTRKRLLRRALPWLLLAVSCSLSAGTLYKWVDAEGNVHYSDTIPPEDARYGRTLLNEEGLPVERVAPAKSAEEIARERQTRMREEEERRRREEQEAQDRQLLNTFHTEQDLFHSRDSKLTAIDQLVGIAEARMDHLRLQLDEKRHQAAELERRGEAVPPELEEEIRTLNEQIQRSRQLVEEKRLERRQVEREYAGYLKRLRELLGTGSDR